MAQEEVQVLSDHEEDQQMLGDADISRAEKKARKAMAKLGLKACPNVSRVAIRRPNNLLFIVSKPDVYKSAVSDSTLT
jgi:nascent polypeptide-associated complex subunit alpha